MENIILRELEKEDLVTINQWRNNKELIDQLGAPFRYINMDVDTQWYNSYLQNRGNNIRLAIYCTKKNIIIGAIYLTNIDLTSRNAELSIWLGDLDYQGKGIGRFAVENMLNHAFNNLNLHRVYLSLLEDNIRAKKLYSSCGFQHEGKMREAVFKNGSYLSLDLMSILKSEFHEN